MEKKIKIKNCVAYGKICNKSNTKGVLSLIIPDDCMPLEGDNIKVEIIPSKRALQERFIASGVIEEWMKKTNKTSFAKNALDHMFDIGTSLYADNMDKALEEALCMEDKKYITIEEMFQIMLHESSKEKENLLASMVHNMNVRLDHIIKNIGEFRKE